MFITILLSLLHSIGQHFFHMYIFCCLFWQNEDHNINSDLTGLTMGLMPLVMLIVCAVFGRLVSKACTTWVYLDERSAAGWPCLLSSTHIHAYKTAYVYMSISLNQCFKFVSATTMRPMLARIFVAIENYVLAWSNHMLILFNCITNNVFVCFMVVYKFCISISTIKNE